MSRNTHDALCLKCKEPIRVSSGDPQYCKECLKALQEEANKLEKFKPD